MPHLLLTLCLLLTGCSSADQTTHQTRYMMGTLVEFSIYGADEERADAAITAAAAEMERINHLFTTHSDSPVTRFNRGERSLPDEVSKLLQISEQIRQQSGGAFNPWLGALNRAWGFSDDLPDNRPLPSARQITTLLPPDSCRTEGAPNKQLHNRRCQLDFGGIAKGYAIDRGIATLKAHNIRNAIINAGGDMRIIGSHGDRAWRIGIRHPRRAEQVIATLRLAGDISVVTSGDYERFIIRDGRRYHHILDPATGEPARGTMSSSVVAKSATLADGWSTALFVLGRAGLQRVERAGLAGLVVDSYGRVYSSSGMQRWMSNRE
ncbi:MAG: FAD:protein FMN transferase [Mariprofundales bacterium]|nr:FAD:protein FMN transferase [Mariprofundales bacterium]